MNFIIVPVILMVTIGTMFFIVYLMEGGYNEIRTFLSSMQEKWRN